MKQSFICIPTKFILIALPITGSLAAIILVMVMKNAETQLHRIMQDKAQSVAQLLTEQLKAPVDFDDIESMNEVVKTISDDIDFGYIHIFRSNGEKLVSYQNSSVVHAPSKRTQTTKRTYFVEANMANVATPIGAGNKPYTLLQIGVTYDRIQRNMRTGMFSTFIAGALVCFSLALVFIGIVKKRKPIAQNESK